MSLTAFVRVTMAPVSKDLLNHVIIADKMILDRYEGSKIRIKMAVKKSKV